MTSSKKDLRKPESVCKTGQTPSTALWQSQWPWPLSDWPQNRKGTSTLYDQCLYEVGPIQTLFIDQTRLYTMDGPTGAKQYIPSSSKGDNAPPGWISGERVRLRTWWLWVRSLVEVTFLSGVFSPFTSAEACEKSSWWLCVSMVWESQETHMRHRLPWYDLSCLSGVKPQYNQYNNIEGQHKNVPKVRNIWMSKGTGTWIKNSRQLNITLKPENAV